MPGFVVDVDCMTAIAGCLRGLFIIRPGKEQRIGSRQQRKRIAGFAHAVNIFYVRQLQDFAVSVRVRNAQLRRCIGKGIDLAIPDALPFRIRNADWI